MLLEVKDIYKSFQSNEVLHGVSFQIKSGHALGLLGRNGAGKTTSISTFHFHRLCGLPVYTAGKKVAVSKDTTLEPGFKLWQFQGRQHAVVM